MRLVARSHPHHQLLLAGKVPRGTNHSILRLCLHLLFTSTSSTNCRKVAIMAWVSPPQATMLPKLKHSSKSNSDNRSKSNSGNRSKSNSGNRSNSKAVEAVQQ